VSACEIVDNRVSTLDGVPRPCLGGGLACLGGSGVVIENSRIARNAANLGAGLYLDGSVSVVNCVLEENECLTEESLQAQGGGLYCWENSNVNVVDCTIRDNRAVGLGAGFGGRGGGAAAFGAGEFRRCVVTGNVSAGGDGSFGGGLYLSGYVRAFDSTIAGNTAGGSSLGDDGLGGGVYVRTGIEGCTVTGNVATSGGGVFASDADIRGCSIVSNGCVVETMNGGGGGISVRGIATMDRSIVWWNCAVGIGDNLFVQANGSIDVTCSAVDPRAGSLGGPGDVTFREVCTLSRARRLVFLKRARVVS
jgi:hypothetical protein